MVLSQGWMLMAAEGEEGVLDLPFPLEGDLARSGDAWAASSASLASKFGSPPQQVIPPARVCH